MPEPTPLDNVALIEQLWPQSEMTDELGDLWLSALRSHNQVRAREAIRRVRMKYSSRTPEIKWVLSEIASMKRSVSEESKADRVERKREELRQERIACVEGQRMMRADLEQESAEVLARARRYVAFTGLAGGNETNEFYVGCLHAACRLIREGTLTERETK